MRITVRCACAVPRTIDTDKVGSWRLRCKTCGDVIYDPKASAIEPLVEDDEDSQFMQWLRESAELKVLMSSEGDRAAPPSQMCERHSDRRVVAACNRCSRLLCRACLDRIGESFTCSECVGATLAASGRGGKGGGLMGFLARLLGRKG